MKTFWFIVHNLLAHPLLCVSNRKSSLPGRFHDWTEKRMSGKHRGAGSKFKEIIEGWTNYIFESPEIERRAKGRAKICAVCEYSESNKFWQVLPDKGIAEARGMQCMLCSCPLSAALRSPEHVCPDTPPRWGAYCPTPVDPNHISKRP